MQSILQPHCAVPLVFKFHVLILLDLLAEMKEAAFSFEEWVQAVQAVKSRRTSMVCRFIWECGTTHCSICCRSTACNQSRYTKARNHKSMAITLHKSIFKPSVHLKMVFMATRVFQQDHLARPSNKPILSVGKAIWISLWRKALQNPTDTAPMLTVS